MKFELKDMGSSNGSYLNKKRLMPINEETQGLCIQEGDLIRFGVDFMDDQGNHSLLYDI